MHGALLHNFVHGTENVTLVDDLGQHSIVQSVVVEHVHKCLLEYLVAYWRSRYVEIFKLRLVIFSHAEFIYQDENHDAASATLVFTERQDHEILQLLIYHIESLSHFIHSLSVFSCFIDYVDLLLIDELGEDAGCFDWDVEHLFILSPSDVQVHSNLLQQDHGFN